MGKFILGFILGLVVATIGLEGVYNLTTRAVDATKTVIVENAKPIEGTAK